ncbi:hypothetical protein NC653_014479 [Populus alba x Populus x berolinensis]|uniref:Uncharacterized protein n=1 Tax=Populus alba x Populus x berolinensis TaxID=444605 RepID=A0AAD6W3Y5_9ROSI|nr:hypothetical protein NC653_014479 [Populus alba x Populus x berolinensis]
MNRWGSTKERKKLFKSGQWGKPQPLWTKAETIALLLDIEATPLAFLHSISIPYAPLFTNRESLSVSIHVEVFNPPKSRDRGREYLSITHTTSVDPSSSLRRVNSLDKYIKEEKKKKKRVGGLSPWVAESSTP